MNNSANTTDQDLVEANYAGEVEANWVYDGSYYAGYVVELVEGGWGAMTTDRDGWPVDLCRHATRVEAEAAVLEGYRIFGEGGAR